MSDVHELIEAVQASGASIRIEGSDLKIKPAGVLPPELKTRLREHKPELLALLQTRELEESMRRLEAANIRIAVFVTEIDAGLQVSHREVRNDSEAQQAITEGGVIYTPMDMFAYIQLAPNERRILRDFGRFRGTVEWKPSQ
jgi:hypothetical protein